MITAFLTMVSLVFGSGTNSPNYVIADGAFCAGMLSQGCEVGWHVLLGPGGGFNGAEAHGDCRRCVFPYPCHSGCNDAEEDNEADQLAYAEARAAAERGDVQSLLSLLADRNQYVVVNHDRGAVQLLSCDRLWVVSNLRLDASYASHATADGNLMSLP